ncbi:hypothetical protein HMPREF1400_00824 [Helicobacter pylori GAM119Bi]|nr:hypothetical protein HMPREF1400_00824 [Helicobacter pylori GAM119Bi]
MACMGISILKNAKAFFKYNNIKELAKKQAIIFKKRSLWVRGIIRGL